MKKNFAVFAVLVAFLVFSPVAFGAYQFNGPLITGTGWDDASSAVLNPGDSFLPGNVVVGGLFGQLSSNSELGIEFVKLNDPTAVVMSGNTLPINAGANTWVNVPFHFVIILPEPGTYTINVWIRQEGGVKTYIANKNVEILIPQAGWNYDFSNVITADAVGVNSIGNLLSVFSTTDNVFAAIHVVRLFGRGVIRFTMTGGPVPDIRDFVYDTNGGTWADFNLWFEFGGLAVGEYEVTASINEYGQGFVPLGAPVGFSVNNSLSNSSIGSDSGGGGGGGGCFISSLK